MKGEHNGRKKGGISEGEKRVYEKEGELAKGNGAGKKIEKEEEGGGSVHIMEERSGREGQVKEKFTKRGESEGPEEEGIGTCQLNLLR